MTRSPMVLVHGFTGTPRTWDDVRPLLVAAHDVHAAGLLGHHGGPPLPAGVEPTIAALADGLERELDRLGLAAAHLVGNSLGGWLALELAARGRARSVVALAPGGGWEDGIAPRRTARAFRRDARLTRLGARHAERLMRRPRVRALALRDVVAHPRRLSPAVAAALVEGSAGCAITLPFLTANPRYPERLAAIDVPVRIAWGTRDRILPSASASARFRTLVPSAEWLELEGLGHLPQHEDPERVATLVLELTRRVDAAAA